MNGRLALRSVVLLYLAALLILPLALVFWRTFENGIGPAIDAVTHPDAVHALWLTVLIALIAVPLNAVFGVAAAMVLVRQRFRGQGVINALIDLPFALSPVVIGWRCCSCSASTAGSGRSSRPVTCRSSTPCRGWSSPP